MKLVGNYLSPYVRRVAVSLHLLELPFTLDALYVFKEPDVVRQLNPVVRIPVLILDDGSSLVESSAILDEIDQIVGQQIDFIHIQDSGMRPRQQAWLETDILLPESFLQIKRAHQHLLAGAQRKINELGLIRCNRRQTTRQG